MVFSYLTEDNIFDKYDKAKTYTEKLTEPFDEFSRIANNKPRDDIDPRYPNTTDGTTASIIRKSPRRILQQVPTGAVIAEEDNWHGIVASYVWREKILPYANEEYDLIQKGWKIIEDGLTFGSTLTYTPFIDHDGYLCSDLTQPYWGDVFIPPGKKSGKSHKFLFLRSWWNKEDIEELIESQKGLSKDVEKTWDVEGLETLLETSDKKDESAKTPTDESKNLNEDVIELVTGFQVGKGAIFYTFHPKSETIVRRKINRDPRGKMPTQWFYGDVDGTNPLGRSIINLIGPLQNLIDADMQMYQFNRALMLSPPIKKKGNYSASNIQYIPNHIIDMGNDPAADAIPLNIDTTAIARYPELYGLQKSQLLNLITSPDTSISATVGNPGFSKTPEGLKQQAAILSVDDNYLRKMFEAWFEDWAESAINIYFAEREGVDVLKLDEETANKLRKLAEEGKFDLELLNEDNEILINYSEETPKLKFRVDASTSKMQDDSSKLEAVIGLLNALRDNQVLASLISQKYPEKVLAAWNKIVSASGVEDPEDMKVDLKQFQADMELAKQAQAAQPGLPPGDMPGPQMEQPPQPPAPMLEPSPQDDLDNQIREQLAQAGLAPDQVEKAIQLLNEGMPPEQLIQMIGGQNGQ